MSKKDENVGELNWAEYDNYLNTHVFIINEIMESKKTYKACFNELYTFMKQGFEKAEVRKHELKFKFSNLAAERVKTMQIRHFIVNLIFWSVFRKLDKITDLNSSHIFDCTQLSGDYISDFINKKIVIPYRTTVDSRDINAALDNMIHQLSTINTDFSMIMATTMGIESFIDLRKRNPRARELMATVHEKGMQPKEIEDENESRLKEFVDIIVNDTDSELRPFLVTGMGLNKQQLSQFAINGGLKPDIEGNVNPTPINSNYVNGGLNTVTHFYIDGQAGCKPLVMNKTVMGQSGHFAYKTMTLSSNYRLSQTVEDCHSARPIEYEVKDKKHLKKINERYYVGDDGELYCIDSDRDTHLIGKTIKLRDPSTCCAHDGVCHVCYGDLYYTNADPHFHAGRFAATQINEPIEQKILSTKHMLKTYSDLIAFADDFYRFFKLDTNKIRLNLDSDEDFSNWKLCVVEDDLFIVDELDENYGDFNYFTENIYLVNKKTHETIKLSDACNRDIFFYGDPVSKFTSVGKNMLGVPLDDLDENSPVGIINIVNNEVSKPLKNIMKLLDRAGNYDCSTVDEMVNKFVDLTIESGMSVMAVHCSMLIKGLIRSTENILLPPDFSDEKKCDDYQILTVSNALLYNPKFTVSISFENLNRQLVNPTTYHKYQPSDYDMFYKEDLYEESQKYYEALKAEKKAKKMRKKKKKKLKFKLMKD